MSRRSNAPRGPKVASRPAHRSSAAAGSGRPFQFSMDENLRIAIQLKIDAFIDDPNEMQLQFPASLTSEQRGYVHKYVLLKNLKSRSQGTGAGRYLVLHKRAGSTLIEAPATIRLSTATRNMCQQLMDGPHRAQPNEIAQLAQFGRCRTDTGGGPSAGHAAAATRSTAGAGDVQQLANASSFRCSLGNQCKLVVPPARKQPNVHDKPRSELPIYAYREHILGTLAGHQVLVVSGDTGSGKTTQVPQYLLEEARRTGRPCRIICTQPRRLAAISIADRVAQERGEQLGHTIGYQIRLESRISQTSNLIYTTSGFLLRCLISGDQRELYASLTHIILDEVHERDKFTDFLLIALKDALPQCAHLKIILMSATIDSDVFTRYFGGCPHVDIPGRMFPVSLFNLEQTLALIGFTNAKVEHYRRQAALAEDPNGAQQPQQQQQQTIAASIEPLPTRPLDSDIQDYVDEVLEECFCAQPTAGDGFCQFMYLVTGESVPVDTQHSQTQMTALMAAASKGLLDVVQQLISLGADPLLDGPFGLNALMWARMNGRDACTAYLAHIIDNAATTAAASADDLAADVAAKREHAANQVLLKAYQSGKGDELDFNLMLRVVQHINRNLPDGAILVFLPGYDSIVDMADTLAAARTEPGDRPLTVLMLHGSMQAQDQKKVFGAAPPGSRKIILSTNIAETSLTIDDVVYVIDSGLVKQKSFDASTGATSLTATCISQACAKQRMGRAGRVRPGVCFRIYSQLRHDSMDAFTLPEILRVPLTEIALSARIMAGDRTSISEFLAKAIQAPPAASVTQSIELLKRIGALDEAENCTQLGRLLVDIPVDVQLGKALLMAVVLRCLDPVLTIVASLSVKDPFVLPMGGGGADGGESQAKLLRRQLADGSCSDHMTLLRVFQQWNESKSSGYERQFCRENFVSSGSLQMICGVRSQIVGHLRSIGMIQHRAPGNIHELNRHSDNWAMVKACLTAGLYPNVCRIDRQRGQLKSRGVNKLMLHQSSVLRQKNPKRAAEDLRALPSEWILFEEMSWAGASCMVRWNTAVSPVTVALLAGPMHMAAAAIVPIRAEQDDDDDDVDDNHDDGDGDDYSDSDAGAETDALGATQLSRFTVDDWIAFEMDTREAHLLRHLRQRLHVAVMRVVAQPQRYCTTAADAHCVDAVAQVLEQEERFCGLGVQPQRDVGRRPIAVRLHLAADATDSGPPERRNGGAGGASSAAAAADRGVYRSSMERGSAKRDTTANGKQHQQQQQHQTSKFAHKSAGSALVRNTANATMATATAKAAALVGGSGGGGGGGSNAADRTPAMGRECRVNSDTARFYVVHASSELQVQQHFREPTNWCWSVDVLKELFVTNIRHPNVDVVLFFYIPAQGRFYGAAKFCSNPHSFRTETLSVRSVTADRLRSVWYKPADARPTTTFDACQNGEEITDRKAAKLLLQKLT